MKELSNIDYYRRKGRLAFCPRCGERKKNYYAKCPACEFKPKSIETLARSIVLSTEQYYFRSDAWEHRTPSENGKFIEVNLIPQLERIAKSLQSGGSFPHSAEEDYWIERFRSKKKQRMPLSLACFLVLVFGGLLASIVLFVKFLLLK